MSLASTGSAPVMDTGEMVAAYSDAAVPELDIFGDEEKDLRAEAVALGREKKRRKKDFMGNERR